MRALAIVSFIITIIFCIVCILLIHDIKDIINKLKKINNTDTNSKVLISSPFKVIRKLVLEINKSIYEKLETKAEYKKINSEIKQSIANIAHDLRTPLTSIIGYIQLIEDGKISDSEKMEYIKIVKKRAKNLQVLIESFYDLSRLESKEYKFQLENISLSQILCDTIALYYNDFINNDIEPVIDIDEKLPLIYADKNAVTRVISNLILNMIRHGREKVEIQLKKQEDGIITVFKNSAPNLSKEDAEHLFDRFFMADRTRNGNNTGLGLTISKGLVEQMGNSIFAELAEGKLSIIIKWKICMVKQ
ncbi:sensor histidine kinase [Clostridium hydrogenum]|uniref:sensor histidine kinase n=1 Tax=Clostridium hydrogenum TaxID=2855764 RepID=UPI001F24DC89|nr:HAMP domain-containing sensor histidine kinase [Clostridium hydrogenum]